MIETASPLESESEMSVRIDSGPRGVGWDLETFSTEHIYNKLSTSTALSAMRWTVILANIGKAAVAQLFAERWLLRSFQYSFSETVSIIRLDQQTSACSFNDLRKPARLG